MYVRLEPSLLWGAAALGVVLLFAVAITMFTSVWGELTRDMRYTLTSVLPIWFLLTPVLYPLSSAPPQLQSWMHLNPMTSLVERSGGACSASAGSTRGHLPRPPPAPSCCWCAA